MNPIKIQLTFIRSSKNYHVYQAEPGAPIIPDKIYVRQDALGPVVPETMVMTLTTDSAYDTGVDALDAAYARGVEAGREAGYQQAVDTLA